jgi:pre-rRNA-processing protein IPI1
MKQSRPSGSQLSKDFQKRKASLKKQTTNRKSQPAINSTNTSFKARSISVPNQKVSRTHDDADAPVGRGNLTLDELVLRLRHPNAHVRRDALLGIRQIRQAHVNAFGHESFSQALPSVARIVSDEDVGVRKVFLEVFEDCLHGVPYRCLQTYAAYVLLQVNSAMTHIYPDIRIDAVRALDTCVDVFRSEAVNGWQRATCDSLQSSTLSTTPTGEDLESRSSGARTMRCYLSMLAVSTTSVGGKLKPVGNGSKATHDLSGLSLLVVLTSLNRFMEVAAQSRTASRGRSDRQEVSEQSFWFMLPYLGHSSDKEALRDFLTAPSASRSNDEEGLDDPKSMSLAHGLATSTAHVAQTFLDCSSTGQETSHQTPSQSSRGDEGLAMERLALFESIAMTLESSFVEAAADIAAEERNHNVASQRMLSTVLRLTLTLWRDVRAASRTQLGSLQRILSRVAVYFPLESKHDDHRQDRADTKHWLDCNLAFCELTCIAFELSRGTSAGKSIETSSSQIGLVQDFAEMLLHSQESKTMLRKERFEAILPSIWMLLNAIDREDRRTAIVRGLLDHWRALSTKDETKLTSTKFLAALLQIERFASYKGRLKMMGNSERRDLIVQWLGVSIPRLIWEVQCSNLEMTDISLACLRLALLTKEDEHDKAWVGEVIRMLQDSLAPFFRIKHRKHGLVEGPYVRLPRQIQRQALALTQLMVGRLQAPLLTAVNAYC